MKTPKRHYELTTMEHSTWSRVWDRAQEHVSAQRWRRKNRIAQLKRTIARLEREKEEAYHRGHKAGYDLGFSRYWF